MDLFVGWIADEFPAFFTPHSGCQAPCRIEQPAEAAQMLQHCKALDLQSGILIGKCRQNCISFGRNHYCMYHNGPGQECQVPFGVALLIADQYIYLVTLPYDFAGWAGYAVSVSQ